MIMPYNRVVHDRNSFSEEELLNKLKEIFDVSDKTDTPVEPEIKGEIGMYVSNGWYRLKAHDDIKSEDAVEGLDVSILQNNVLKPILGIEDPRTDERIEFVGGIRGLKELEKRTGNEGVAFSMYPTTISELFAVADDSRLMPPKSTWFEPKLMSGLFIHEF